MTIEDLEHRLTQFAKIHSVKYDIKNLSFNFWKSLKEIENSFITITKDTKNTRVVEFQNPSIQDFLVNYLRKNESIINDLIGGVQFFNQLFSVFTLYPTSEYKICLGDKSIQLFENKLLKEFDSLILLI